MERVEAYTSRAASMGQLLLCLLPGAGGFWLFYDKQVMAKSIVGWFFPIAFFACGLKVLLNMLQRRPRLVLTDEGLYDRQLGTTLIRWQDILAAKPVLFFGSVHIMFILSDEQERLRLVSLWQRYTKFSARLFGLSSFTLNPNGLDIARDQVLRLIEKKLIETGLLRNEDQGGPPNFTLKQPPSSGSGDLPRMGTPLHQDPA